MEKPKGKKAKINSNKDKITKSFADLIRGYQKEGYPTRESIEMDYSKEYHEKTKKTKKNKTDKTVE